ncbi:MAG TPA: hypothetical protein VIK14_12205 [Ignavibacteria bacterium]
MKTKLRGKKLNIMKPQTRYAKVPLEVLSHPKLTPVDKLIITYLYSQSDSGNYILAYTRIAKELSISKKWVIERWKWLKQNDYILEDDQNYFVAIGMPEDEILKLKKGEESLPKVKLEGEQNAPIDDISKVNKIHPIGEDTTPTIGEHNTPTKVNKLHLNGEVTTPNEYNEEVKKKSEYKIEQGGSGLGSVSLQSLASASQLAPSRHTPSMVVESGNTPKVEVKESFTSKVENECQRIITHPNCQHIFTNNPKWQVYNEKLFKLSNATIGYEVCKYMLKYHDNPNKQSESEHIQYLNSDEGKFMNYMFYIVKYSQKLEGSNIWQSFVYECGLEYKENLIKSLTLS